MIHAASIQVNANTSGHAYVVEQGIKPGDKIVVEGIANLREGLTIKPRWMNADSVYASF
jgi:membrane fusion protein (multidrug efflux system)